MASVWPAKNNYATGDVLTAANMNGVGDDLNDVYNFSGYAAGKNKIINGDFGIWQRGTSFSNPTSTAYTADRWLVDHDGTGATRTVSQQTFTPATAPVAGYEGTYFYRYAVSAAGTGNTYQQFSQKIENVRTFAGQTVTFSFWAKADAARTLSILVNRIFGSGGSAGDQSSAGSVTLTTSWARYTVTATLGSVSGKTIGAGSYIEWVLRPPAATVQTIDVWGVQLEAGSTVSIFQTATGTIQGELAACQRYYWRETPGTPGSRYTAMLGATSGTDSYGTINNPVPMRTTPTSVDYSALNVVNAGTSTFAVTSITLNPSLGTKNNSGVSVFVASGLTTGQWHCIQTSTSSGYIGFSAEL